jgi:hypothetical protein
MKLLVQIAALEIAKDYDVPGVDIIARTPKRLPDAP